MNFKSLIAVFNIILLLFFVSTACNQDKSASNTLLDPKPIIYTSNPFEYVGVDHNNTSDIFVILNEA